MNIFYSENINALFTKDISGISPKKIDSMDNHHIFPKSRVKNFSNQSQFNSIAQIPI
jgi:hypothetical protein